MSKRQEIRDRRRRDQVRNRIIVIIVVVLGALLVTFALILPSINQATAATRATQTAANATPVPVISITPRVFSAKVDGVHLGDPNAPVKVDAYEDFRCSANDGSDASVRSANAALCANEQGHFWDYHDTLYANQVTESASLYTDARLVTMAENLKLDMTAFNACYKAKKYASVVSNDGTKAQSLGVSGTPSIFVNGTMVANFANTTQAIDTALAGK